MADLASAHNLQGHLAWPSRISSGAIMWALSYNGMSSQLEQVEQIDKFRMPDKATIRSQQQISEFQRMNRANRFHFRQGWISRGILNRSRLVFSFLQGLNSSRMTRWEEALTLSVIRRMHQSPSHRVSRSISSSLRCLKEVTFSPSDHLPPLSSSTKDL